MEFSFKQVIALPYLNRTLHNFSKAQLFHYYSPFFIKIKVTRQFGEVTESGAYCSAASTNRNSGAGNTPRSRIKAAAQQRATASAAAAARGAGEEERCM